MVDALFKPDMLILAVEYITTNCISLLPPHALTCKHGTQQGGPEEAHLLLVLWEDISRPPALEYGSVRTQEGIHHEFEAIVCRYGCFFTFSSLFFPSSLSFLISHLLF